MTRGKSLSFSFHKQAIATRQFPKNVAEINYILSNISLGQVFKAFNPLERG